MATTGTSPSSNIFVTTGIVTRSYTRRLQAVMAAALGDVKVEASTAQETTPKKAKRLGKRSAGATTVTTKAAASRVGLAKIVTAAAKSVGPVKSIATQTATLPLPRKWYECDFGKVIGGKFMTISDFEDYVAKLATGASPKWTGLVTSRSNSCISFHKRHYFPKKHIKDIIKMFLYKKTHFRPLKIVSIGSISYQLQYGDV